ncbi:MAG: UDP-N-acetylmuramoyl-L-alanyl-D-glutamate--2,6-diaminopimelate ligase [Bacilli bacterium]|nr:UDP-N-acetylmuramoyl-L-alanyl-D-glutamate--2,6-diaminopimelate ligase [Bacilli bacterium]
MKKLNELISCDYNIDIFGITDDSRKVKNGYLFVATRGYNVDHFNYIDEAINNGAVAIVTDRKIRKNIPIIVVSNINDLYYEICEKYYDVDLSYFNFIGITGTDGKTTTSTIVKRLLNNIRKTCYIGTNGVEIGSDYYNINNTTPCIEELYYILSLCKKNNCKDIVMEVSSEALLHERVKNFIYKVVGFTNITEDHLNVHKSLESYIECKKRLTNYLDDNGICIVNGDDNNCRSIVSNNTVTFGFDLSNDCIIKLVDKNNEHTIFEINYLDNCYKIISPFVGKYNIYNVTMSFLICLHYGLSPEYLVDSISKLKCVSGRREVLDFGQDFEIILDYAHTFNGIKEVIESVDKNKRLIVVTGCAGGREKEKRHLIGDYILNNCDISIFTMDDPRYEDVNDIIDDMVGNSNLKYMRIIDRKKAIFEAFDLADSNTTVLILGKGRDNYMAIGNRKEYYSDYDSIKEYFDK